MARGKEALASSRQRYEAAVAHIDRLTSELAELKIRTRAAEQRATHLASIEKMIAERDEYDSNQFLDLIAKLTWWKNVAEEDRERRWKAIYELRDVVVKDLFSVMKMPITLVDRIEFVAKRYPAIMSALTGGGVDHWRPGEKGSVPFRSLKSQFVSFESKLPAAKLREWQRLVGERGTTTWDPERDLADVLIDLLEAGQAGFSRDEILEVIGVEN